MSDKIIIAVTSFAMGMVFTVLTDAVFPPQRFYVEPWKLAFLSAGFVVWGYIVLRYILQRSHG